jgi:murein DD-endopeptidase MepM/ murein hydrolase activator NlpD
LVALVSDIGKMRKKVKYKYNPKTLQYEQIEMNLRGFMLKSLKYGGVGLVIAGIVVLIAYPFIKDYSTRKAQEKITFLENNFDEVNSEMNNVVTVLEGLQETDNDLYRVLFSAEPFNKKMLVRAAAPNKKNHAEYVFAIQDKLSSITRSLVTQSKSFDELIALASNKEKMIESIPSIIPIADKDLTRLSSGYGYRIDPVYHVRKMHAGIDFTSPTGSPIHCSGDGTVEKKGYSTGGYGNEIVVNHGFGYKSHYAHLSKFNNIKVGQKVKRGETIGYVGSTGKSTAPHLHYEIIKNGNKIDPINFFFNDITPEQYQLMIEKSLNSGSSLD